MKHKGRCVKFLYRELKAPKEALILSCVFKEAGLSISRGFDSQASQKIRRYDDKKVSYLPLINLVPSPSRGRRNALYIQTSIPLYIHNYPSSGLRPPSPARGEGNALYLHTSEITPNPLQQGAREKTLAAQLPSCLAAEPTTTRPRTSLRSNDGDLLLKEVNRLTSIHPNLHTSGIRRCA